MTSANDALDLKAFNILDSVIDLPASERAAAVTAQTQGDATLRARVLRLLDADAAPDASHFTGGALEFLAAETPPAQIGNYSIEREIGRGGMGAVYLGHRNVGDFDHVAAIKVVRLTSSAATRLSERLRSERRLLAQLKHPNIAQFHDGGETGDGSPFLVMEYVEGAPLIAYIDDAKPSIAVRISVFRQTCLAVAYAHRNLVVHRDLTPSNVLVTQDGVAKVIDFGISQTVSEAAIETGPRHTMTKGYAAPERIKGEPATTLSDIYALGVILDDLIAGTAPERREDILAIARKARSEDPGRRYQSVDALVDDIDRYLAARAVAARGGGRRYALTRFIQRRRFAVSAGALAAIGVIAAGVAGQILYLRADRAEIQAVQRFNEVRSLASVMLYDLHDDIADIPGSTRARERLADTARTYLDALSRTPNADFGLKLETAEGYKRLADVMGVPNGANLGRRAEAKALLDAAMIQLAGLRAERPKDAEAIRAYANAAYSYAIFEFVGRDDTGAGRERAADAVVAFEALSATGAASTADTIRLIEARSTLGEILVWAGDGERGLAELRKAQAAADDLAAAHPHDPAVRMAHAEVAVDLGDSLSRHADAVGGGYDEALAALDDGVSRYLELHGAQSSNYELTRRLANAYWKRAIVYYGVERDADAVADLDAASVLGKMLTDRDPNDLGAVRFMNSVNLNRAKSLVYLDRYDEAIALTKRNIEDRIALSVAEPDNPAHIREVADGYLSLADMLFTGKNYVEGCPALRAAVENFTHARAMLGSPSATAEPHAGYISDADARCVEQAL